MYNAKPIITKRYIEMDTYFCKLFYILSDSLLETRKVYFFIENKKP